MYIQVYNFPHGKTLQAGENALVPAHKYALRQSSPQESPNDGKNCRPMDHAYWNQDTTIH